MKTKRTKGAKDTVRLQADEEEGGQLVPFSAAQVIKKRCYVIKKSSERDLVLVFRPAVIVEAGCGFDACSCLGKASLASLPLSDGAAPSALSILKLMGEWLTDTCLC